MVNKLNGTILGVNYNSNDQGREHFIERVESRHGIRTIEHAEELGIGTTNYEIIEI